MKKRIIDLFNENDKSLTKDEIYRYLDLKNIKEDTELKATLNSLEAENIIMTNNKGKYNFINRFGYYIGIINVKEQGFGFVKTETGGEEIEFYVARENINHALDKDKVLFAVLGKEYYSPSFRAEAKVIKVIERNLKFLVGKIALNKKGALRFKKDDTSFDLHIDIDDFLDTTPGDVVKVEIIDFTATAVAKAKIVQVLGNVNDVGMDILSLAVSHGFETEFAKEVLDEINEYKEEFRNPKRRNLRNKKIITIDGADAKDLDDAVSIERLTNGNYLLGVYIADVSFYVKEGSFLDKAAYDRGTSCYLTDRVIPMLPRKLSNDLCSLNENTDKLIIGVEIELDENANIINHDIFEGIMATTYRMTYEDVNKILDGNKVLIEEYQLIYQELIWMRQLAHRLRTNKEKRGYIDFDIPEGKVIVDELGHPTDVIIRTRGEGERIIEDFMILANETIAQTIYHLGLPFIYRIHSEPNTNKFEEFKKIAQILGYSTKVNKNKIYASQLQELLVNIKEDDAFLKTLILRTMAKARYSEENIGHFGLASECYTHFTSPIRRYPDLIVHRYLRKYLFNGNVNGDEIDSIYSKIADIARQSSEKEKDAIQLEYDVDDMKKAEYMENYIGEEYEGIISGVTGFGMFVTLSNTVEGLVHVSDMDDDYYEYHPEFKMLIGRKTGRKYRIGNKIKIFVYKASKKNREINFKIVYNKDSEIKSDKKRDEANGKYKGHRQKQKGKS